MKDYDITIQFNAKSINVEGLEDLVNAIEKIISIKEDIEVYEDEMLECIRKLDPNYLKEE
jgi:hypothetical protein